MNIPDNIRVNASFPFPALVQGSGPITLTKINGIWTIGYNGSALGVINTAPPLTGGPIDLSGGGGAIGLAPSGVVAGSYTNTNLTVNAQGLLTAASSGTGGGGSGAGTVSFTSFGAVGDGATDNSGAWNAFNTFARAESTAGRGVNLVIPPGTYNYDGSLCNNYFYGIKKLHVIGYGAVIQNTYDRNIHGANSAFEWALSPPCQVNLFSSTDPSNIIGPLIQTTAIGDTTVTLLTPSKISQFAVGDWVMVSSLDIQYFGFPPSCDNLDFVQITAINAGTGVLTFSTGLMCAHRSDFADGANTVPCGKARVWQLSSIVTWDIDHVYEGIEVRIAPNTDLSYLNMAGKSWKAVNCILPGASPSVAKTVEIRGGVLVGGNEPDKLVQNFTIDGTWIKSGISFQSSSIDCVSIRGSRIDSFLETGQTKQTLVQNCSVFGFTEGVAGPYGTARGLTLENCIIHQMPLAGLLPTQTITFDSNTTYANGVFRILPAGDQSKWTVTLGSMVNLCHANGFSGSIGTGIVTKISDEPGTQNLLVKTTLPYATLPSWVAGLALCRHTNFSVHNCSGCDQIINHNKLTAEGLNLWGNFELLFTGASNRDIFDLPPDCIGNLISVTADVTQAYPAGGGGSLQLGFGTFDATTMAPPNLPYNINIDLSIVGKRVFTQTALTGKAGADNVDYNGTTLTTLKVGAWVWNFEWNYFLNIANLFPVPMVRLLLQFDVGMIRVQVPAIGMDP